jgi:hypothetical protein
MVFERWEQMISAMLCCFSLLTSTSSTERMIVAPHKEKTKSKSKEGEERVSTKHGCCFDLYTSMRLMIE